MYSLNIRPLKTSFVCIALFLGVIPCHAQKTSKHSIPNPLEQLSESLQAVVEKTSIAIVEVEVLGYNRPREYDEDGDDDGSKDPPRARHRTHVLTKTRSFGSGVILEPDGYIVTNAHVLEGARRVRITLDERLRRLRGQSIGPPTSATYDAQIVGTFEEADLALVKIDAHGLPTIPIADSDKVQPGQLVFAVGSPEKLKNSVSMGIVSGVGRSNESDHAATYIQTDAAINAGSSGGALVDMKGNLIGITSFILTIGGGSEGLGFALPSKLVYSVFERLKNSGSVDYGDIGIQVQNVTPVLATGLQLPQDWGVIISDVAPDSSAATAGVKAQDMILALDGNVISNTPQFVAAFYNKREGESVRLRLLRGSDRVSVDVPILDHHSRSERFFDPATLDRGLVTKLGIVCVPFDGKTHLPASRMRSESGVIVAAELSTADTDAGLMVGDVIRAVNGTPVTNVDGLRSLIDRLGLGDAAVLQIERRGRFKYVAIEIN